MNKFKEIFTYKLLVLVYPLFVFFIAWLIENFELNMCTSGGWLGSCIKGIVVFLVPHFILILAPWIVWLVMYFPKKETTPKTHRGFALFFFGFSSILLFLNLISLLSH